MKREWHGENSCPFGCKEKSINTINFWLSFETNLVQFGRVLVKIYGRLKPWYKIQRNYPGKTSEQDLKWS